MDFMKKRKCDEIIVRLYNNYQSEKSTELTESIGKSDQDFITRKLYNSTVRVGKLVHIHYDYISNLLKLTD